MRLRIVVARAALCLLVAVLAASGQTAEVRFLCFAPSPYTQRHDAFRAGMGILLSLRQLIAQHKLPLRATFYDGVPALEDGAKARALLRGPRVLVIGSSTWAQGSSYYLRRYFELANLESLAGVSATAWATSGGAHTGGETVINDTLRTLMGMGAQVFSLGQKYMVFTTDERLEPAEGDFTLLDCWYMDQFARQIAVVALGAQSAKTLGFSPFYWNSLPKDAGALARYRGLQQQINAARDPRSEAYQKLRGLLAVP